MHTHTPHAVAALRILLTVAWVFGVALWPMTLWRWQLISVVMLLALTVGVRLPLRTLVRRVAVVWLLTGVMSLGLFGQPGWSLRAGNLLLKSTLSLWIVNVLVHTTPLPLLAAGLRHLRVPRIWAESFSFWGRYYSVLANEWERLQLARRARTFEPNRRRDFAALGNTLGLLFIRAYERAEQVHRAMLARGYSEKSR